ncbi:MAG TPA: Holliday junction resolvase RuvX, partial [Sedimentisphaerales bacterium]|nr:Holliday junction resolvase RuvX [Sedimentisphaerales bacterium]
PQAKLVRTFGDELGRRLGIPVFFQDERLSSFEAEQRLREMDLSRTKRKARLDALAAADILQSFLDRKAGR